MCADRRSVEYTKSMGNKDHRTRETKKPKKKKDAAATPAPTRREDFKKSAFRSVQDAFKRSES